MIAYRYKVCNTNSQRQHTHIIKCTTAMDKNEMKLKQANQTPGVFLDFQPKYHRMKFTRMILFAWHCCCLRFFFMFVKTTKKFFMVSYDAYNR